MSNASTKSIKEHARRFRSALDKCPKSILPIQFKKFPRGSCGDTSLILAKHLSCVGQGTFDYVEADTGSRHDGTWYGHGWLQQDDLIIDITADQFPDVETPVIVTTDRSWYDKFEIRKIHSADLDQYDGQTRTELTVVYYKVVDYLETP